MGVLYIKRRGVLYRKPGGHRHRRRIDRPCIFATSIVHPHSSYKQFCSTCVHVFHIGSAFALLPMHTMAKHSAESAPQSIAKSLAYFVPQIKMIINICREAMYAHMQPAVDQIVDMCLANDLATKKILCCGTAASTRRTEQKRVWTH